MKRQLAAGIVSIVRPVRRNLPSCKRTQEHHGAKSRQKSQHPMSGFCCAHKTKLHLVYTEGNCCYSSFIQGNLLDKPT